MTKTTLQVLEEARALISDPAKWTKGGMARNASGDFVESDDDSAVCWDPIGAVLKVGGDTGAIYGAYVALGAQVWMRAPASVEEFNDDPRTTHADVLALFDRAIVAERVKQEAA